MALQGNPQCREQVLSHRYLVRRLFRGSLPYPDRFPHPSQHQDLLECQLRDRGSLSCRLEQLLQLLHNRDSRHSSNLDYHQNSSRVFRHNSNRDCPHNRKRDSPLNRNRACRHNRVYHPKHSLDYHPNQEYPMVLPSQAVILALVIRVSRQQEDFQEHHHRFLVNNRLLRLNSEPHNQATPVSSPDIRHSRVSRPCLDIRHSQDSSPEHQDIHHSQVSASRDNKDVQDLINLPCQERETCTNRLRNLDVWTPTKCPIPSR